MNYSFSSLSPADFEDLSRDLLQAELDLDLESFSQGRDQGIDLRYAGSSGAELIVQCKHYRKAGFKKLLSHMKSQELPKIRALDPGRYILVTSVPLTPHNKTIIMSALEPFVRAPGDIYGPSDLNSLLGKYQDIERRHFKLWLASTEALDRFFQRAEHVRSEALIERARSKLRLYAQNESFVRALETLEKHHVCVIAGEPGIGKTTLADVLMVTHLDQEYEVIEVTADISEADRCFRANVNQFFYYDDFLGTAFDERLPKNEDGRILRFIQRIEKSSNKRLVLTTREYILRNASSRYEKLEAGLKVDRKCIVSVEDYTRYIRAKILYNHIHFSALRGPSKRALVRNKRYNGVIRHRNFNPRLVEHAIDFFLSGVGSRKSFPETLLEVLEDPSRLWSHAFCNQISKESQSILLSLLFLPRASFLEDLHRASRQLCMERLGKDLSAFEFYKQVRVLEGTFLRLEMVEGSGINRHKAVFSNPAIRDYLTNFLSEEHYEIVSILRASVYFEQVLNLCQAATTTGSLIGTSSACSSLRHPSRFPKLIEGVRSAGGALVESVSRTLTEATCVPSRFVFLPKSSDYDRQPTLDARLVSLSEVSKRLSLDVLTQLVRSLVESSYERWARNDGDRNAIARILQWQQVPKHVLDSLRDWALAEIELADDFSLAEALFDQDALEVEEVEIAFDSFVDGMEAYILGVDEYDDAIQTQNDVEDLARNLGLAPNWDVEEIGAHIDYLAEAQDEFDYKRAALEPHDEHLGEQAEIDDLFATLI